MKKDRGQKLQGRKEIGNKSTLINFCNAYWIKKALPFCDPLEKIGECLGLLHDYVPSVPEGQNMRLLGQNIMVHLLTYVYGFTKRVNEY